jgi:ketopantoate reductase
MTGSRAEPVRAATRRRTLVVGAGAVGSFLGGLLGSVGHDVTLIRIFEPDSERPLVLVRPDGSRVTIPVHRFTSTADAPAPDLILVAVKMPALREALAPTLRWPEVPTLTVENGIGAEGIAAEVRPAAPMLAGSLTAPIRLGS